LEESGDIDQQVRLFSQNLFSNQIEDEKVNLEAEHRKKIDEIRLQNLEEIARAKERLEKEQKVRLERDRQREVAK